MTYPHRTIFITGGTSGIGRGFAQALHKLGHKVIIGGRRKNLLTEITTSNPGMAGIELDVTNPDSIAQATAMLLKDFPDTNVLFNNAGIMPFDDPSGPIDDTVAERLFATNLLGPIRMSSALVEHLKKQPEASILYMTSILAFVPLAGNSLYSAAKAALHSYILSQRFQLRDTNVQVQEIAPPWIDTDLMGRSDDPRAMDLQDYLDQTVSRLWNGEPELVIDAVAQLRDNPGSNEHAMVDAFNKSFAKNPIRTAQ